MNTEKIYLDYAATTPVDPRVFESMMPYFKDDFGNPSSIHLWGQRAEAAIEQSRRKIATCLGCNPSEIIFTSCGSESDNLALRGIAHRAREQRNADHILLSPVEHHAVLRTAQQLKNSFGFDVEFLPIDSHGQVSPDDLARAIRPKTAIVSIIHANNEIGTINQIETLSSLCQSRGIPFHTDSVQAASQLPVNVKQLGVDLMSIGAHKFYGPKGVGALYIKAGLELDPILTGGSQEHALRAGTHNVPLIVGMAEALEITVSERERHNQSYLELRDKLLDEVPVLIPDTKISGHPTSRLPNHASFVFKRIDGNQLLIGLDIAGFGCSSGSACKTGDPAPSDVLNAIGVHEDWALGSLRVTVGRPTSVEDVDRFIEFLPGLVEKLRHSND